MRGVSPGRGNACYQSPTGAAMGGECSTRTKADSWATNTALEWVARS